LKSGDAQRAIAHFHRSLEADSNFVEARAELADAYATLGEFGKAIEEMKQLLGPTRTAHFTTASDGGTRKLGQILRSQCGFRRGQQAERNPTRE
jgi:tetratricopeptide (TPR) repeat protein